MKPTALVFLIVSAITPAWTQSPDLADQFRQPIDNYSLQANSFIDALLKTAARFKVPMGIEWIKSADTLKPFQLLRSHTSAVDVIQAVVSAYAGYDWRIEDGVAHVFQRNLVNDGRNPLNITLKSFGGTETVKLADASLFQEVWRVTRMPDSFGIPISILDNPHPPVFNFAVRNVPARHILNKIVTAGLSPPTPGMSRLWVMTMPETPTFSRTGFLEVVPMKIPAGEPPDYQPFWVLLPWGDPPSENMQK